MILLKTILANNVAILQFRELFMKKTAASSLHELPTCLFRKKTIWFYSGPGIICFYKFSTYYNYMLVWTWQELWV